jgi:hypothetical protein
VLAAGCLRTPDVEPVLVDWTFPAGDTIGCEAAAVEVPEMRIRTHVQTAAPDDEFIDWAPCVVVDPIGGLERHDALMTPLEHDVYYVECEMWVDQRTRRVAHQQDPKTAVLVTPDDVYPVSVMMVADPVLQPRHEQLP